MLFNLLNFNPITMPQDRQPQETDEDEGFEHNERASEVCLMHLFEPFVSKSEQITTRATIQAADASSQVKSAIDSSTVKNPIGARTAIDDSEGDNAKRIQDKTGANGAA